MFLVQKRIIQYFKYTTLQQLTRKQTTAAMAECDNIEIKSRHGALKLHTVLSRKSSIGYSAFNFYHTFFIRLVQFLVLARNDSKPRTHLQMKPLGHRAGK